MTATLPQVMDNLREKYADMSETDLAMTAATLIVSYEWEQAGKVPTSRWDLWPDVQLLLTQYGYKVGP